MRNIIFLAIILVILSDITHQTEFKQQNVPKLRSFSIKSLKKLRELRKAFEIKRKLLEELEKKEVALQNKQLLEEYEEGKRFFEQFLVPRHPGTSFLSDFHTDRLF